MKKIIQEFKEFAIKGNFIDMAIGIVMGSAFTAIVNSIVGDIFMPLISLITGGINLADKNVVLKGDITLNYGNLIQNIITFLIIALCMFAIVKAINNLTKKNEKKEEPAPKEDSDELKELKLISSLLKENMNKK